MMVKAKVMAEAMVMVEVRARVMTRAMYRKHGLFRHRIFIVPGEGKNGVRSSCDPVWYVF